MRKQPDRVSITKVGSSIHLLFVVNVSGSEVGKRRRQHLVEYVILKW
jgi:hypothetical protein